MKKHVLNIDRLYAGQTANALVLTQVDEDFPILIPSLRGNEEGTLKGWIEKVQETHPDFNPVADLSDTLLVQNLKLKDITAINNTVIEFNLALQEQFKEKGHSELYMMDDTSAMKPNEATQATDKQYLHCLNGKEVNTDNNSSQLNVLFPWRKLSSKSLYSTQLRVQSDDLDDELERARGITLQGKLSYEKCLQEAATVGSNIYMLAPNIYVGIRDVRQLLNANSTTVLSQIGELENNLTLFQPS